MTTVRSKGTPSLSLVEPGTVWLPLRFMVAGVLSFLAALVWIALKPEILSTYHYNQSVIAATHLVVLGWICSVVMGATYQLVPVALETTLHSQKQARWHFVCHLVGFIGMVAMFAIWNMKQVGHFGSIFGVGVGLFAWNMFRTFKKISRWDLVAFSIASAVSWLVITMLAGLFLATVKCWPQISPFDPIASMHAHAHLGILGCFVILTVGVSYKLIPMFALSDIQNYRRAWASVILLNLAVAGAVVTVLIGSKLKLLFGIVALAGVACYLLEMTAIVRARKRRELDWGLKTFMTAVSFLGVVALIGTFLAWPTLTLTTLIGQVENLYGFLALFGFITLAIMGMMHKIIPFLVWYYSYSRQIGKNKVPALADLYSVSLQKVSYFTFVAGLLAASTSILLQHSGGVRLSALLMLLGALFLGANIGLIFRHLLKPRLEPLASARPVRPALRPAHSTSSLTPA